MDGATVQATHPIESSSTSWRIVAVGDFGSSSAATAPDGSSDLILADYGVGNLAIRYMTAYNQSSQATIMNGASAFTFAHDKEHEVVAAGDWAGNDGRLDLLVRHVTQGRMFYWCLNGAAFSQAYALTPTQWDPDWLMCAQSATNSAGG
jgi:hypothetical protein